MTLENKENFNNHAKWQSFLPWHVLDELAAAGTASQPAGEVGQARVYQCVALFADISGFTAISEALGAAGHLGTEELTGILNSYFDPMIDLIHQYGGSIGKFGGDAMTVLFPFVVERGGGRQAARAALQCALEMQARMPAYAAIATSAGVYRLAMKAGLAAGPILCTLVGDPAVRLEFVIAGAVLDRCAEAEHHAAPGDVIAHEEVLALAEEALPEAAAPPWIHVACLASTTALMGLPEVGNLSAVPDEVAWAFIHPSIAERLRQRQESFINEHRRVTVLFMSFAGFDYDGDGSEAHGRRVCRELQDYLSQVFKRVAAYSGYINKVDMGDKGSKIIILFGAPLAYEDDIQAALCCALELVHLPGAQARIGVNTGFAFCGQVGSDVRREYTVMGDAVNLAARLMQKAQDGQVLVGETTQRAAPPRFRWGEALQVMLKGKKQPVGVYTLLGEQERLTLGLKAPRYDLMMVGRQAELEMTANCIGLARQGQGQVIGITAGIGMGKSRLAAEVIRMALEAGLAGYGGDCLSHGVNTSYLVWRSLLHDALNLQGHQSLEEQIAVVEAALSHIAPGLERRAPLLGLALNVAIPENDLTRSMEARLRKESLEDLVVTFLRALAQRQPLLLALEDCHWIDPLSADLLETVAHDLSGEAILILVMYRPLEPERAPAYTRLPHFHEIRLKELTLAETGQLIRQRLIQLGVQADNMPENLVVQINERAQGNPFFVDEMINWLHKHESVLRAALEAGALQEMGTLDLPDSLQSLIISRIDQLQEAAKTTLKVASVIGRSFRASWLWGIFPDLGAPDRVREQLVELSRLEITALDSISPELEYLFKHIVTREVAYESLALSTRQMLHEHAGMFIESNFPAELDRFVDLLAYHYSLSANTLKQREYFAKAAHTAQRAYANAVAVDYYQRLLLLVDGLEKASVLLHLAELLVMIGEWDQAEQAGRQALEITQAVSSAHKVAECQYMLGVVERHRGNYPQALQWLKKAHHDFRLLDDSANLCDALREIGIVHWSQGEYRSALRRFQDCLRLTKKMQDLQRMSRAFGNISNVYLAQEDDARALKYARRGLKLAEQVGDRVGVSTFVGNMGIIYQGTGDYVQAMDCFLRYLSISQELGFRMGISIAIGNIGNVYLNSGSYEPALKCYALNLKMAMDLGDQLGVAIVMWNQAMAHIAQDDLIAAEQLLSKAIALGRSLDTPYELSDFLSTQAALYAKAGRWEESLAANNEALQLAQSVDRQPLVFTARVLHIWLTWKIDSAQGHEESARLAAVQALADLASAAADGAQQAALTYLLWETTGENDARQSAAEQYQALYARTPDARYRQRYRQLSGVDLPAPILPPLPELIK